MRYTDDGNTVLTSQFTERSQNSTDIRVAIGVHIAEIRGKRVKHQQTRFWIPFKRLGHLFEMLADIQLLILPLGSFNRQIVDPL
jgi:hypothetical protein